MKKYLLTAIAALGLTLNACDDYLDINDDPNNPTESVLTTDLIFPTMEVNLASTYGNFLRIVGGYLSEQYSQMFGTGNYLSYSQFTISSTRTSGMCYTQLFMRVISTGESVIRKAEADGDWGTYLAAKTLRAFAYSTLVDCYGEVPYTEAIAGISQPHYDDGRTIYDGIIAELDEALAKVSPAAKVCTNFIYPGESANNWIRFANALKLKLYTRISNVDDKALDKIAEIIKEGNLPVADVALKDCWTSEAGAENPFYAEEFATNFGSTQSNVIANIAIVGTMQRADYTDPRLAAFFEPNSEGGYRGGLSGTNFSTASGVFNDKSFNRPVASYDMPVFFITLSEIEFMKAEYYARKGDAANAKTYYENAITASFATAGVSGAAENIAYYPYDQNNWKKCIGLAKYLALSGTNNFESWCELRRLRYPEFDASVKMEDIFNPADKNSYDASVYKPGTLYTPYQVDHFVGGNQLLERFPYASASATNNPNAPVITDQTYTTKVFWAK